MGDSRRTDGIGHTDPKGERPTIGLIADDIILVGGQNALLGVADVARERDVNLICFHQCVFPKDEWTPAEVGPETGPASWDSLAEVIDGLVLYQSWPSEEAFADFRSRFPSLPMVNALRVYGGYHGLAPDSYRGTKELTSHLVEVHGYRRIAFATGPEGNWAVQERYRGYVDALTEHGLSLDPNLVTPHFSWEEGREAISLLMDERKLLPGADFEAVVAANDLIALSILSEVQTRGVRVPDDVAVVGFDDRSQSSCSMPPLTTARLPSYEIGRRAAEVLLAQMAGERVPERTLVPARMMVRRSCGCQFLAVTQAAMGPVKRPSKGAVLGDVLRTHQARILSDMVQAIGDDDAGSAVSGWAEQLLGSFAAEVEGGASNLFLTTLESVLSQVMVTGEGLIDPGQRVAAWQGAVSALRRWVLPYLDRKAGPRAEGLWQQARVMITEMVEQAQAYQTLQTERQAAVLREVSRTLTTTLDMERLMDVLAKELPRLDVPGIYVSLYKDPEESDGWSRLMLAYGEEGRVDLGAGGMRFPSRQLTPEGILPDRRYSFVVEPLYFQEYQLGFALFEAGPREGMVYDVLRAEISSALQGALLLRERERAEEALERRAVKLQTVAEVGREAAAILDVRQLLDRTVNLVSEGFGFYHVGIFLLDELGQYAVLRAASSEGGQRMLERGHSLPVGQVGVVGHVAAANEPHIALDVGEDAVFFDNPDLPETRSEMALPLSVHREVIGVLDVQSEEPSAFTEEDVATLRILADQLAVAIQNARLVERSEEQLRELNLLYGQFSAETWDRLLAADRPQGYVYDRVDVLPVDEVPSPAYDLAVERDTVVELDASEMSPSVLAVPLRVRGQVIGSLGVEAGDSQGWTPEEVTLIEAVGEQVAQAIDGARLFAEAQKTALSMESLYQTSRAISSSLEEEEMIRAVLEAVYRTLNCEYVLLNAVDEEAKTINLVHGIWQGEFDVYPEWFEMGKYSFDDHDIIPDIYRSGRTEIIGEWDDRFNREIWEKFGHERFLRVFMPINLRERVIGVIEVAFDKHRKDRISDDEVQMLSAFMDQAAVALENVRLFDQVQRRAQREHRIYEIANRLRRSPDISTILQTAVDELGQALQVDRAMVRLRVKPRE